MTLVAAGLLAGCGGGEAQTPAPTPVAPVAPGQAPTLPAEPTVGAATPPATRRKGRIRPPRRDPRKQGFQGIEVSAGRVSTRRVMLPQGVPAPLVLRSGDGRRHAVLLAGPRPLRIRVPARRVVRADVSGLAPGRYGVRVDGRATGAVITVFAPP